MPQCRKASDYGDFIHLICGYTTQLTRDTSVLHMLFYENVKFMNILDSEVLVWSGGADLSVISSKVFAIEPHSTGKVRRISAKQSIFLV